MDSLRKPIAAVALLGAFYWLIAATGPLAVGAWQDDAIYIATAKSLAAGNGYRHAEIPGEPLQAKYPVLYPAVLAVLLRLAPDYPGNVPLLLLPTAFAAAALVVLSALYWKRIFGLKKRDYLALGALAAFSPAILSMIRFTMSDLLYAGLAMAAISLLDDSAPGGEEAKGRSEGRSSGVSLGRVCAAAALIGASALTRSIGLTLAGGAILFLCWRRRWRDAAVLGGIVALCIAPWHVWQVWAAGVNDAAFGGSPLGTILLSELNYGVWAPSSLADVLRVLWQNIFHIVFGIVYFQLGLPENFGMQALAGSSWRTALLHSGGYLVFLSVLAGFASSARARPAAVHFCILPYAVVVLAYPGDPYRFLLPWVPFILYFLFRGVVWIGSAAAAPKAGRRAASVLFAIFALAFSVEAGRIVSSDENHFYFRVTRQDVSDSRDLEAKLLEFTEPDDVIASGDFAALYLSTGRQGFYIWPITDPYALFYGPDRNWWSFYIRGGKAGVDFLKNEVNQELESTYRAARVQWVVDNARPDPLTAGVRSFMARNPEWFEPRYLTPREMFLIYRARIPQG